MEDYILIVTKSTVPVGTAIKVRRAVEQELHKRSCAIDFDVASNPEFLKEGAAIDDFLKPDRIVIGLETERARELMKNLYKPFTPVSYTHLDVYKRQHIHCDKGFLFPFAVVVNTFGHDFLS